MTAPRTALLLVDHRFALRKLCRRALVERLAIQFVRLGLRRIVIAASDEVAVQVPEGIELAICGLEASAIAEALGEADHSLVVVASGRLVADDRLLQAALDAEEPTRFTSSGRELPLAVLAPGLASSAEPFARIADDPQVAVRDTAALPAFWLAQRRVLEPYGMAVADDAGLDLARRILGNTAGKGHQEWSVILFNRPVETLLSRTICEWPVTPNQITLVSIIAGLAACLLVARGMLGWGLVLAMAHMVLDGLDGRQARTQLRFSPIGELEHAADKLVEIGLLLALGWHLEQAHPGHSLFAASAVWCGVMFADNASGSWFRKRAGFLPDLATPFDAAIRLVAPRRNTNIAYLAIGGLAGSLVPTFWTVAALACVTTVLHWLRALRLAARLPMQPWLERLGEAAKRPLIVHLFSVPSVVVARRTTDPVAV